MPQASETSALARLSRVNLVRYLPQLIILALLGLAWSLYGALTGGSFLLPRPDEVVEVLGADFAKIFESIGASGLLLGLSSLIALVLGVLMGMLCGQFERLKGAVLPIARVLAPIPSLIYAPYAVAIVGDFFWAAVFVIASGLFWPVLFNTVNAIEDISDELINSARTLNLPTRTMFAWVMLPHCLPYLFNTLSVQVSNAFLLLVGAEMMGMRSGVGWYVKYWADYSNFTTVFAGIVVIAVIVFVVNILLEKFRDRVLSWK
ncbi:MAG: ABC transporter permease subunit [Coriobacteriales bacterium]|nr:ABC transporter permease subunit [Coriobacteriales bacterium]